MSAMLCVTLLIDWPLDLRGGTGGGEAEIVAIVDIALSTESGIGGLAAGLISAAGAPNIGSGNFTRDSAETGSFEDFGPGTSPRPGDINMITFPPPFPSRRLNLTLCFVIGKSPKRNVLFQQSSDQQIGWVGSPSKRGITSPSRKVVLPSSYPSGLPTFFRSYTLMAIFEYGVTFLNGAEHGGYNNS